MRPGSSAARRRSGWRLDGMPESRLFSSQAAMRVVIVYGLLELAERVRFGSNPAIALHLTKALEEKPANEIRTVSRYFCSELEDKPWYLRQEICGAAI